MSFGNTAQRADLILIQKGATTIGGIRTRNFVINAQTVDVTTADDVNRWQQLLAATGVKKMTISGGGVLKDTAAQQALATDIAAQTNDTYTFTVPGMGTFGGLFTLTQLQMGGQADHEATFDATWESAGDMTFTAEG